jgi:hypothetical protein
LKDAEFMVYGMTPGEPRTLLFQHEGQKLSGQLELKGTEREPIEIKLQPSGAVFGRLVDTEGRPMGHAEFKVYYQYDDDKGVLHDHHPGRVVTDDKGRFRVNGLVPGLRYLGLVRLKGKVYPGNAFRDLSVKPGESRDLGDVQPQTRDE